MKRLLQLAVLILFIAALAYYGVYFGLTNPRLEKLEKKSQELINRLSLLKPQVGLNTEELKEIKKMLEGKTTSAQTASETQSQTFYLTSNIGQYVLLQDEPVAQSGNIAITGTLYASFIAGDGSLITDVDAETLDGYDSTAFALAHLHPYLNLVGGVMTGNIIWNPTQTFGNTTLANLNELVSGASTTLHTHPGGGFWADNATYIYPTNVGTSFQILDSGGLTVAGPISGATTITATGLITGGSFSGDGSALTSLNASQLSSGTVPSARLSGSYTGITGLGTIATGTWQGTVITNAYVADDLTISGGTVNNTPIGAITPSTGAFTTGSFSGQAAFNYNLGAPFTVSNSTVVTNLNADLLDGFNASDFVSAGTYVSLQATTPGTQQTGNINVSGTVIGGTFSGSGASLTSLNASNLSSGTVPSARISGSYTGITGVGTLTVGTWNADVIADAYIANDLTISGGTINSTPIGSTTPSTGAFTAVTSPNVYGSTAASGNLNLYSTSDVTKGNIYLNVLTTYIDSAGNLVTSGTVDGVDVSAHAAASSGVHGVTGSVVGTTDTQTLTNKTLSTGSTWNGNVIGLAYGGTGANLTAASGGIVYSGASALAISGAGTSGQLLVSGGTGSPTWTSSPSVTSLTASTSVSSPSYTGTGAVTLSSGGTSDLTLDAAGNLVLADANIDLTGGTTVTFRRNSATADLLTLDNIGAGSLSLNLADGALQTAGVTRISNAGAGTLTSLDLASGGITNAGSITGVGANITGTGALTLASGGAGQLTLDSASGTVALASGDSLSVPGNLTVAGTSNVIPYIYGSTAASGNLTLESTSNATKGYVILQPNGGNVGIGTTNPVSGKLQVNNSSGVGIYVSNTGTDNWGIDVQSAKYGLQVNTTLDTGTERLADFTANGVSRLRIQHNGNVGIGNTGPIERLEVTGGARVGQAPATFTTLSAAMDATQTTATVVSTSGYPSAGTLLIDSEAMTYTGTTSTTFTGLTRGALGTTAATHSSGATVKNYLLTALATSTTPKMVITGDGNVGIGTTGPGALLDIQGSTESLYLRRANGANSNAPNLRIRKARGTVTSPTIVADTDFAGHISFEGYDGAAFIEGAEIRAIINGAPALNNMPTELAFRVNSGTSGTTERMRIDKIGNVGIGTTGPAKTLSVVGASSADAEIRITNSAARAVGNLERLSFAVDSGQNIHAWIDAINTGGANAAAALTFNTWDGAAPGERMRITNNGNVGIGTTGPGALLDIQGSTESLYLRRANGANSNAPNLRIRKARGTVTSPTIVADTDFAGHISFEGYDGAAFIEGAEIRAIINGAPALNNMPTELAFRVNSGTSGTTERMRIDKIGNVGIGTTGPGAKLDLRDGDFFLTDADVAHGITSFSLTTNTYGGLQIDGATAGGLRVWGIGDTVGQRGLVNLGILGDADPTDTVAAVTLAAGKKNGATIQAIGNLETALKVENWGTALVTVLGNGNVGIGTTTPVDTFHVVGQGSFGDSVTTGNSERALNLISTDAVMRVLRISANIDTAAPGVELMHRTTADGSDTDYWDFFVNSAGFNIRDRAPTDNTRLTIANNGNVGIGNTGPIERLEVTGGARVGQAPTTFTTLSAAMDATQTTATVVSTTGYPSAGTLLIDSEAMTYTGTTATTFTGLTRGALGTTAVAHSSGATVKNYLFTALATSTTPKMVITGDGNVGIGTTGPTHKLHVAGTDGVVRLQATGTGGKWWDLHSRQVDGDFRLSYSADGSSFTSYVTVLSTGNVGIGTTNPGGGTGSSVLSLANSSAAPTALANTTHLYSSAGEGYWMDAAGNVTLQTPHNPETGEWIFSSQNINTGKILRVEMERLTKDLDKILGGGYVFENNQPYTKEGENLLSTISNLKQRIAFLEAQPQNQTPSTGILTQDQESILAMFEISKEGTLVVKGDLEIQGKLTAERLKVKNPDTKGQITIKAGESEAVYVFTKSYETVPTTVLTPTNDPGTRYWVEPGKEKFTVKLAAPASSDITFNYLVVE